MKPGAGARKGGAFEREVCKRLSLWVSNGKHIDLFWRTAMSGGRSTVQRRKGKVVRQSGDICSVAQEGHPLTETFFIETKAYKQLQIDRFLVTGTGTLAKFWMVAKKEARVAGKRPLLIARQNALPVIVVTNRSTFGLVGPIGHSAKLQAFVYLFDELLQQRFSP